MANLLQNVLIQFGKNFDRPYLKSYKKVGRPLSCDIIDLYTS